MSSDQKKNMIVTLWKSGKKGKAIIIGAVVIVLGIIGSFMDSSSEGVTNTEEVAIETTEKPQTKPAAKQTEPVIKKGKSIMNFVKNWRERSKEHKELYEKFHNSSKATVEHAYGTRAGIIQRLYEDDFRSPITEEQAKIDASKPRYSLFGGTLKAGTIIEIPSDVDDNKSTFSAKMGDRDVDFTRTCGGKIITPKTFADDTEIWRMEYHVKEFMGLTFTKTMWYRAPGSSKLELFYAMVRRDHAQSTKDAENIRQRMIKAVQGKYAEMEHTFNDKVSDEYTYNGDVLTVEQSVQVSSMSMLDAPWVQVGIITPSIVVKILKSLDEQDQKEFEAAKKADSGALDNF